MTNVCGGCEAAVEQLYDELLARTWALHKVLASGATDVTRAEVSTQLATAARNHVLQFGHPGRDAELRLLLWPTGASPPVDDPWWATPLGRLIDACRPRPATVDRGLDLADSVVAG